jgi:hypothetical protein
MNNYRNTGNMADLEINLKNIVIRMIDTTETRHALSVLPAAAPSIPAAQSCRHRAIIPNVLRPYLQYKNQ